MHEIHTGTRIKLAVGVLAVIVLGAEVYWSMSLQPAAQIEAPTLQALVTKGQSNAPVMTTPANDSSSTPSNIPDKQPSDTRLLGVWQSTTDAKFSREFKADGTVIDRYAGDASANETGLWKLIVPAVEKGLPVPPSAVKDLLVYKLVIGKDPEPLYFSLVTVDDKSLKMGYLGRGNTLSFTRVQ